MLPKRLEVQAFGPYVKKQQIDFTQFMKDRLFLLEGETGSGKTMLLDAMTYALYGKSSGGQREDLESMRSRFASEQMPTIVDFTFTIKEKEYRFFRSVEVRTKRNKEKAYKVNVDAGEMIDGCFHPFFENPKLRSVEEKAQELIGLSYLQFVQVMLLPQGKFEQFLTSRSEEKQDILKTLFQMERWSSINGWLTDKLNQKRNALDLLKQQMAADLRSLNEESMQAAQQTYASLTEQIAQDNEQKNALLQQQENVQADLLQQKEYHRWKEDYKLKQQQYEKEKQQEGQMKQQKEQVLRWKQMQQLRHMYQEMQRLQKAKELRKAQYIQAKDRKQKASQQYACLDEQNKSIQGYEEQIQTAREQLLQCEEQLRLLKTFDKQKQQSEQLATAYQAIHKQNIEWKQKNMALQKTQQLLQQEIQAFEQEAKQHEQLKADWQYYVLAEKRYQKQTALQEQMNKQKQAWMNAQSAYQQQQETLKKRQQQHDALYQQFLEHSALQLAESLQEGKPCPVCGSFHHPKPYVAQKAAVDLLTLRSLKQQLEEGKQKEEQLYRLEEKQQAAYALLKKQLKDIQTQIQELLQKPFLLEEYHQIKKQYKELIKAEERQSQRRQKLQVLQSSALQRQEQLEASLLQEQTKQQNYLMAKAEVAALQKRLPQQDLKQLQTQYEQQQKSLKYLQEQKNLQLQQREASIIEYNKAIEHYQTSEQEYRQAQQQLQQQQEQLEEEVVKQQVKIVELETMPSDTDIENSASEVERYFLNLAHLEEEIRKQEEYLAKIVWLDLDKLVAQDAKLKEELLQIQECLAQRQSEQKIYARTLSALQNQMKELAIVEPDYLRMQHFVKAMRGDQGIGIERYVLGVLLDNITTQANKLLAHIHEGRYQIFRNDDTTGRSRKYGLELSIFDTYSMEPRNVVSLSGGEKFLVSLAMSLALSMVVQARNGGIRFDCMFIDEGFGTLDEHSIADALAILQTMTQGKGMIGIISHVEILKENIQAGIAVVKTREGSYIQIRKGA